MPKSKKAADAIKSDFKDWAKRMKQKYLDSKMMDEYDAEKKKEKAVRAESFVQKRNPSSRDKVERHKVGYIYATDKRKMPAKFREKYEEPQKKAKTPARFIGSDPDMKRIRHKSRAIRVDSNGVPIKRPKAKGEDYENIKGVPSDFDSKKMKLKLKKMKKNKSIYMGPRRHKIAPEGIRSGGISTSPDKRGA